MISKNLDSAKKQAQANANYFQCDYVVFFDTLGNSRIERYESQNVDGQIIVNPSMESSKDAQQLRKQGGANETL